MQARGMTCLRYFWYSQLHWIVLAIALPFDLFVIWTASIGGEQLLALISNLRTLEVLLNSAGIAVAATLFSALIATINCLSARTDLFWRRFCPSPPFYPGVSDYVGGFALIAAFGPKRSLLQLARTLASKSCQKSLLAVYPGTYFLHPHLLLSIRAYKN